MDGDDEAEQGAEELVVDSLASLAGVQEAYCAEMSLNLCVPPFEARVLWEGVVQS